MEILPAWLIEELKKMEEQKRQSDRRQIQLEIPVLEPSCPRPEPDSEQSEHEITFIPLY